MAGESGGLWPEVVKGFFAMAVAGIAAFGGYKAGFSHAEIIQAAPAKPDINISPSDPTTVSHQAIDLDTSGFYSRYPQNMQQVRCRDIIIDALGKRGVTVDSVAPDTAWFRFDNDGLLTMWCRPDHSIDGFFVSLQQGIAQPRMRAIGEIVKRIPQFYINSRH